MRRRRFLYSTAWAATGLLSPSWLLGDETRPPSVSITIDDPHTNPTPILSARERNDRLLATLKTAGLQGALFVCGMRVDSPEGLDLVRRWGEQGHLIGNHSYSHLYYNSPRMTFERYSADFLRGEALIRDLPGFTRLYRFPVLKEGETALKRDAMRAFLEAQHYGNGAVTIDTSDWYIDQRLRERLEKEPDADLAPYRDFYLQHLTDRMSYYDSLAVKLLNRPIRHTILLHHNLLNTLFLYDFLERVEEMGWNAVDTQQAFSDPVFSRAPDIVPAGESLLWALAKESGRFGDLLRYPGEDSRYEKEKMDALGL